jgi:hypothetical protein
VIFVNLALIVCWAVEDESDKARKRLWSGFLVVRCTDGWGALEIESTFGTVFIGVAGFLVDHWGVTTRYMRIICSDGCFDT